MPSAPYDLSISAARAGALFASPLQRSDEPSAGQVRQAIATAIGVHGVRGCAPRDTPAQGDRPQARARTRRRRTPLFAYLTGVSPRLEFTTLTCGPNTGTRRLDQNARICTVPGLPGLDREAAHIEGICAPDAPHCRMAPRSVTS